MLAYVIRHRPSPAMVVACAALAVALGGTGYAALKLPRNSVGTKQLKNSAVTNRKLAPGAVTGAKVARNSLTGVQINEATLGTVSSATHAASADSAANATSATTATTAQNLAAPEAFHIVGAPGEPTFQNSWQNNPTIYGYAAGFYKDRSGVVHLVGRISGGSGNNAIFQLPPGYRPAAGKSTSLPAACECAAGAQAAIISIEGSGFSATFDGAIFMTNGNLPPGNSLWLDGVSFLAES